MPDAQDEAREGVRNSDVASNSDNWHSAFFLSHVTKTWGKRVAGWLERHHVCVNCERDSI